MKTIVKYLILFVGMLALVSAFNMPIPEIIETSPSSQALVELETKFNQAAISFAPLLQGCLFTKISFPHHINLRPQLEVLEFLKPPSPFLF